MKTDNSWSRLQPWLSTLVRLTLAGVFLVAGGLKITDLDGSARAVNAYELMPFEAAKVVGAVQPVLEMGIGLLLLLGLATRLTAWLAAISMVVFLAGISSAWARGLSIDCGCFSKGGALPVGTDPDYTWDILRDVAFLGLAGFLILFPTSRFSIDGGLGKTSTLEEDERE